MNNKISWSSMMESRTETRMKIKTPTVVALIMGLHIVAVGSIVLIQGCGTPRPEVDAPEKAVLPPGPDVKEARPVTPPPRVPPAPIPPEPVETRVPELQTYEVQPGDSLSVIARRTGVSQETLIDLNNIRDPDRIVVGQKLLLPSHAKAPDRVEARPEPRPRTPDAEGVTYEVQPGDTLSHIAVRHGTTVRALREANELTTDTIRVGDRLTVPGMDREPRRERREEPEAVPTAPAPEPLPVPEPAPPEAHMMPEDSLFEYTVSDGDTLESISVDFAVLKDAIRQYNDMEEGDRVRPGQRLLIPPPVSP